MKFLKDFTKEHKIATIAVLIALAVVIIVIGSVVASLGDHQKAAAPSKSDPSQQTISVEGEMVCLPHKGAGEVHTLECAIGLKLDNGKYYALRDPTSDYSIIGKVGVGERVKAFGTLKEEESSTYQSVGVLTLDSLAKTE